MLFHRALPAYFTGFTDYPLLQLAEVESPNEMMCNDYLFER